MLKTKEEIKKEVLEEVNKMFPFSKEPVLTDYTIDRTILNYSEEIEKEIEKMLNRVRVKSDGRGDLQELLSKIKGKEIN